ncbi:hypothetical protein HGM15179_020468 [Zosterops borbonicus]|uniref:glutaminyl-peptide cyclotransferase n=1 Tax=Zosterops borbonicus TaxID=364589 RepID=A0A8K1FUZ4_9PASS|nr:hypothetical protein HGM15179_020468 [Zosterops borbonicus]
MRPVPAGSRRSRAAGSSPGPVSGPLPVPVPGPGRFRGLLPRSPRPARPLLALLLLLAAAASLLFLAWPGGGESGTGGAAPPGPPSERALRTLLSHLDPARLWGSLLRPLLHERVPGGPGSRAARQHVLSHLRSLGAPWHLELDTFSAATPRGQVTFSSVVATAEPRGAKRLVLACHLDTKVLAPPSPGDTPGDTPEVPFVGATDAAVPCALLLEVATALDAHLRDRAGQAPALTLQLLFLDGEEAFGDWSVTDSLYGARHLAAKMAARGHPAGSEVTAMELLVLLDLLGGPAPAIHSHFTRSHRWFLRLAAIEQRLRRLGLGHVAPQAPPMFRLSPAPGPVEDDHVPFLQRDPKFCVPDPKFCVLDTKFCVPDPKFGSHTLNFVSQTLNFVSLTPNFEP